MKLLQIALKDLRSTFQNAFSLVMMFGAPLLITGLLYFAFGGLAGGAEGFSLPVTKVVVANLDKPGPQAGGFAAGETLVEFLQSEELAGMLEITLANDEAGARAAVEGQKAGVAIIIPPDFTAATFAPERQATIILYQDPTLSIGPRIVKDLASHFLDGFSGAKIAAYVAADQLAAHGGAGDAALAGETAQAYVAWLNESGHGSADVPRLAISSPAGQPQAAEAEAVPMGPIMAGMIVFFVFFMGANGAESLIREDEAGTLARLFTTPTSQATILAGKFLGVTVTLSIQVALLLLASALLFGIHWGQTATLALVSLGLVAAAAGFGVLLMSFIKNSRQTGPVMGGVLTLTGMLGGLFTNGIPDMPAAFDTFTLATPQGWAMQAWKLALAGAGPLEVIAPALVMAGMGIAFLAAGVALFRKRFA